MKILLKRFNFCSAVILAMILLGFVSPNLRAQTTDKHHEGRHANGARWAFDLPEKWNGTLLLFSPGYGGTGATQRPVSTSVNPAVKDWLLKNGYALAGTAYSKSGWAVEEGLSDPLLTLDVFTEKVGKPKKAIAWGTSMGGLVTLGLIEKNPQRFDGGMCLCASVGGVVGMLNISLDGTFAFKTLLAPNSDLPLVNIKDEAERAKLFKQILDDAQKTAEGRARIALAAALGEVPLWGRGKPEPAADDYAAQQENQYKSFMFAGVLPRKPLEDRAGGNFSWNIGVDYRKQVILSGRFEAVKALYKNAGLDLEKDLQTLNEAPRIGADPPAVTYMKRNFVSSGKIGRPLLTMTSPGDDATTYAHEEGLASYVREAGRQEFLRQVLVRQPGHCVFSASEAAAAILTLERRIDSGKWGDTSPAVMNKLAESLNIDKPAFINETPPKFLRPCSTRKSKCAGEK